ncbi:MAG: hypothetical protein KTR31_00780 [Myxococcales bacterium]|nr:hypothetical protein [Myxococcales bacterium]
MVRSTTVGRRTRGPRASTRAWVSGIALVLAVSCNDFPSKGKAPPPHLVTEGPYTVIKQQDAGCNGRPSPRRWAHMAYFFLDEGAIAIQDGDRTHHVERGFLLYGGQRGAARKDDLWLYDLTFRGFGRSSLASGDPEDLCPWFQMTSDATPTSGIHGGGMQIQGDDVVLFGGVVQDGSTRTISAIYRASLHDLPSGFSASGGLSALEYAGVIQASPGCEPGARPASCVEIDENGVEGDIVEQGEIGDVCSPTLRNFVICDCLNGQIFATHCPESPECTPDGNNDGSEDYAYASVDGLAFMGYGSRLGNAFPVYGGITGCVGGPCTNWQAAFGLYEPDDPSVTASPVLEAFGNSSRPFVGYASSSHNVHATYLEDMFADQRLRYGWTPSMGVSHTAGSTLGLDFHHSQRSWVSHGATDILVGGTYNQGIYPVSDHTGVPLLATYESCGGGTRGYWGSQSDWQPVDSPIPDTSASSALLADDGWVLTYDEGLGWTTEIHSTALGDARYDAAVTRFDRDSFLVVGGRGNVLATESGTAVHMAGTIDSAGTLFVDPVANTEDPIRRYGASVVHDPLLNDAFYFGGRVDGVDSAKYVMQVHSATGAKPNATSEFFVEASEVDVVFDGAWQVDAAIKVRHECRGDTDVDKQGSLTLRSPDPDDCFAENVAIVVPAAFLPELPDPQVDMPDVTFSFLGTDGETQGLTDAALPVRLAFEAGALGTRVVMLQLPKAITDGAYFSIQMRSFPRKEPNTEYYSYLDAPPHQLAEVRYDTNNWIELITQGFPLWVTRTVPEDPRHSGEELTDEEYVALAHALANDTLEYPIAAADVRIDPIGAASNWTPLAPGQQVACSPGFFSMLEHAPEGQAPSLQATCWRQAPNKPAAFPSRFVMMVMDPGVQLVHSTVIPGLNNLLNVWAPTAHLTLAANNRLTDYSTTLRTSALGDLEDDVVWLADRLAVNLPDPQRVPAGDINLVYLPYSPSGPNRHGLTGAHIEGLIVMNAFDETGDLFPEGTNASDASSLEAITVHELSHMWTRKHRFCFDDAETCAHTLWITEGLPEYMRWLRYPQERNSILSPWVAISKVIDTLGSDVPDADAVRCQDLEDPRSEGCLDSLFHKNYQLAPYVVGQLHEMSRSLQNVDFWEHAVPMLRTSDRLTLLSSPLDATDTQRFVGMASMGHHNHTTIYDQMVARGSYGLPLLGITEWSYTPATGIASVQIEQVQVNGFGWPAFDVVPYYLGSVRLDAGAGDLAFTTAITGQANGAGHPTNRIFGAFKDTPERLTSVVATHSMVANPAIPITGSPFPADVALYANELLLAELTPQRTSIGREEHLIWYRVCEPAPPPAVAPGACQPDGDLDWYDDDPRPQSEGSDCDPGKDTTHPMAPDAPGPWTGGTLVTGPTEDVNCDGWWGGLL